MRRVCLVLAIGVLVGNLVGVVPVRAGEVVFDERNVGEAGLKLAIYAVGAGYSEKVDGVTVSNNWDFVELAGAPGVELDGYAVQYTRSSGTSAEIRLEGVMSGEAILLRYKNSPQKDGDFFYSFDLAAGGGKVELLLEGEVVDGVSWGSVGENDGRFGREKYYPLWEEGWHGWIEAEEVPEDDEAVAAQCLDLEFSEIYSYFEESYAEQFVEIYNPTDVGISLEGCVIRYKNKEYAMSGEVGAEEYLDYRNENMKLTKNPTNSNYIELADVTGEVVARAEWKKGQKKGVSLVYLGVDEEGSGVWAQSYMRTPGAENVWQEYRSCPDGKIINPATGNCIGVLETEEPLPCPEGKFRNPETNRCKSLETIDSILAPCKEGQYRNPETNRCKSLTSLATATLAPCAEGYERNPETNRCRKIRENSGADYGVGTVSYGDKSTFMAYGAMAAVGICGAVYIIWQFRREIAKPFRLGFARIKA